MRMPRRLIGLVLVVLAVPALIAGGAGWAALTHRDADGGFSGPLAGARATGYAFVVEDLAALVHREVPFLRWSGGRVRVTAEGVGGPSARDRIFIAAAPADAVATFLRDVPHSKILRVRPARGPLPVDLAEVPGTRPPTAPAGLRLWTASGVGHLSVRLDSAAGPMSLVMMRIDGQAGVDLLARAAVEPAGLVGTTAGLLAGGLLALLAGATMVLWRRNRWRRPGDRPATLATLGATGTPPPPLSLNLRWRRTAEEEPVGASTPSGSAPPDWPPP
jgi:hypothetical protein